MIQKTAESTGDLIGNKIADRITSLKNLTQNNSGENIEHDREIHRKIYISSAKTEND